MLFYALSDWHGHVKVGITTDTGLRARVQSLQTGNPYPLEPIISVPGSTDRVRALERQFLAKHSRMMGEWLQETPELLRDLHQASGIEEWFDHADLANYQRQQDTAREVLEDAVSSARLPRGGKATTAYSILRALVMHSALSRRDLQRRLARSGRAVFNDALDELQGWGVIVFRDGKFQRC